MSEQTTRQPSQPDPAPNGSGTGGNYYLKKIAKNAGIAASGRIFSQIFGPLIGIVTTRILGAELYGIYTLATQWTGIMADISRLGFAGALIRFIGKYTGEKRADKIKGAILLTLKVSFIGGGILTAALFLFAGPFSRAVLDQSQQGIDWHDVAAAFRFFAPAILLTSLYGVFISALTGFQQQRYVVFANSIVSNLVKLGTLVGLYYFGFTLYAALASSLIQDLVIMVLGGILMLKVFPTLRDKTVRPVTESKEMWSFSGTLFANSLFYKYTFNLDLIFLGLYRSVAEVGLYGIALKLQPLIYLPSYAISEIFNPIVAELYAAEETAEIERLYKIITKWSMLLTMPIFLVIVLFHKELLTIFGKEFAGASQALIILAFGNLIVGAVGIAGHVITMIGRVRVNLINSILTAVINVTLFLLLIPPYGMLGAAIAFSSGMVFVNLIRLVQVYLFLRIHPFMISLLKVLAASALALGGELLLLDVLPINWNYWLLALHILICLLLYTGFTILFRFDEADLVILRALGNRLGIKKRGG